MSDLRFVYRDLEYPWNIVTDIFGEYIADEIRQEFCADVSDICKGIEYAIGTMKDISIAITKDRYVEGMTYRKIGDKHGISGARAEQIVKRALRTLRHPNRARYIKNGYSGELRRQAAQKKLLEQQEEENKILCEREEAERKGLVGPGFTYVDDIVLLDSLGLSVRSYNALHRYGFVDARDVVDFGLKHEYGLYLIRNLGDKSIMEIEDTFLRNGLISKRIFTRKLD